MRKSGDDKDYDEMIIRMKMFNCEELLGSHNTIIDTKDSDCIIQQTQRCLPLAQGHVKRPRVRVHGGSHTSKGVRESGESNWRARR